VRIFFHSSSVFSTLAVGCSGALSAVSMACFLVSSAVQAQNGIAAASRNAAFIAKELRVPA
jgi:hypothetical protein